MNTPKQRYRAWRNLCVILTLLLGVVLCKNNSPLYQHIGVDNAIFLSMGRGMTQGLIPYVDLVENKGPLFFWLMALPQWLIPGTTGVFLLEECMLAGMAVMIFACVRWLGGE